MDIYSDFIKKLQSARNKERSTVVFLKGDLGSGKTTFVKNLCKYLDLNIGIHSPTFVILKSYDIDVCDFKHIIHIDAYRLNSFQDLVTLKIEEYVNNKDNIIFIEWPSVVKSAFLKPDIEIDFEHVFDTNERVVRII